jgi:predicted RNA-binding Zn ribbon-like protein
VRENWRWIRAQIVLSFAESYIETPQRIKVCKNALCRWAFVDTTKSNIRCWCNDRRCGNRARVRRSRAANRRAKM